MLGVDILLDGEERRIAATIEYDGTGTLGFQSQFSREPTSELKRPKSTLGRTVQKQLEESLSSFFGHPVIVDGSGRTDAGVHATAQVIAFTLKGKACSRSLSAILRGANSVLPGWIRIVKVADVGLEFLPRFRARSRTYHYLVLEGQSGIYHPLWSRFCHVEPRLLDLDGMVKAARPLLGWHDFRIFSRGEPEEKNTVRELEVLKLDRPFPASVTDAPIGPFADFSHMIRFEVIANAFLRRMVRQLVGQLLKVGRGEWPVERPFEVLTGQSRCRPAAAAPAQGLFLANVDYLHLSSIQWIDGQRGAKS
jgi:tRNA pseudouridine38-40 synthase